jgi:hypothetical protein
MSDINELMNEVTKGIQQKRTKFDSIRWGNHSIEDKIKGKKNVEEEIPLHLRIKTKTKEEMYQELKDKFRFAWKSMT